MYPCECISYRYRYHSPNQNLSQHFISSGLLSLFILTKTAESKVAMVASVRALMMCALKEIEVFPVEVWVTSICIMSPRWAEEIKFISPMYLVAHTEPVISLACIPQASSTQRIREPPCRLPWAFKWGCVTRYLYDHWKDINYFPSQSERKGAESISRYSSNVDFFEINVVLTSGI